MRIRPGTRNDLAGVLALERATETAPHWNEDAYVRALREDNGHCLFVADDSGVRGFAVGSAVAGETELESVVVAPEQRRCGVGRALCEAVIDWAQLAGARSIALEVRAGSAGAIALYAGLQFRVAGRRKDYYAEPREDALIMVLEFSKLD